MIWEMSWRADPAARAIADRHYNRQSIGAPQFVPPGRCLVLRAPCALWVTSWPLAAYVGHAWAGAWVCSAFRNEGAELSSALILAALAATVWRWPATPRVPAMHICRRTDRSDVEPIEISMITFVDERHTRAKRDSGRCFRRAGFVEVGRTREKNLVALGLPVAALPAAQAPRNTQRRLFAEVAR